MPEALNVLMRWLHISSVASLIGGLLYGHLVATASKELLPAEARERLERKTAGLFRPVVITAMVAMLISGTYNILSNPGHTVKYHALLGIKLLLVAHIFASAMLAVQPAHPRRGRLMYGAAISGLAVIAISAYLRRIF